MKNAKDRGALWRISKDGRTSYLYGTIHIGRAEWMFPGPELSSALAETGALAIEVDITAPDAEQERSAAMAAAPSMTLTDVDRVRLAALGKALCIPDGSFEGVHPLLQVIALSAYIGHRDGLYQEFAQEVALIDHARGSARPVVSLESMAIQMDAVLPDDAAVARSAFHDSLTELEAPDARSQLRYVADAWQRGDLTAIDTVEEVCRCKPTRQQRKDFRALNDGRNPGLARRIAEEHAKGVPVLAAVGILHMTGDKAIPKLLAEMGFEVVRVAY
ncbi:MAG: TraB/GumN family protein [Gammaproteobacteria bacterium]